MKKVFMSLMIIIGTIIGAGFASGQEMASFFNRFGDAGKLGLMVAAIIFGLVVYFTLRLADKKDVAKYNDLVKNDKITLTIIKLFSFICFCIMISAVGSYGAERLNISFWGGAIVASSICFILFLFKFAGLEKLNNFLVPFILIGVVALGFIKFDSGILETLPADVTSVKPSIFMQNWIVSSILYASYNSIVLIPIIVELKSYKMKKIETIILSIFTAFLIATLGLLIYNAIDVYYPNILGAELPTLILAKSCGQIIYYIYSVIILFAIFTTAFSCGFAFLKMNSEKNYLRNAIIISVAGVILSRIGFSSMINFFFPLFGYLGIVQIIMIAILAKKNGGK